MPHALGLLSEREMVVEQNWQFQEQSGVFTICYCSVEDPDCPPLEWGGIYDYLQRWRKPVRAQVQRLAFTISPPNFASWNSADVDPEDAPECMITLLVQADLGGALGANSYVKPLLSPFSMTWLGALIRSVLQVRDSLQQKRFVEPLHRLFGDPQVDGDVAKPTSIWLRAADFASYAVAAAKVPLNSSQTNDNRGSHDEDNLGNHIQKGEDSQHEEEPDTEFFQCCEQEPTSPATVKAWLPERFFYSPDATQFNVRSATYLQKKTKQPSAPAAFRLAALEALSTERPELHISPYLPVVSMSNAPFLMPIHFTLPYNGKPMHLVIVFVTDRDPTDENGDVEYAPFERALAEFVAGTTPADDARRSSTLKMIPMVKEGSWVMRQAVGSTPVIIGNKLTTTYHRGPNYLEITVDISSNSTAANITNFVAGAVSSVSIWLGFVLEGRRPEHLPERLLGSVCLNRLDLSCAKHIDNSSGIPPLNPDKKSLLRVKGSSHSSPGLLAPETAGMQPCTNNNRSDCSESESLSNRLEAATLTSSPSTPSGVSSRQAVAVTGFEVLEPSE